MNHPMFKKIIYGVYAVPGQEYSDMDKCVLIPSHSVGTTLPPTSPSLRRMGSLRPLPSSRRQLPVTLTGELYGAAPCAEKGDHIVTT